MSITCGQCGEPIDEDAPDPDLEKRKPCPKCGSKHRAIGLSATGKISSSATASMTVITYPQRLLTLARRLSDEGEHGISIVVAHVACSVATQRTLEDAVKGNPEYQKKVSDCGHSLNRLNVRKLYKEITGDDIERLPLWRQFKDSADLRNEVVHETPTVTKQHAENSLEACSEVVKHLDK
jgi:hypothetical protein